MSFLVTPVVDDWGTTYELTTGGYTVLVIIMLGILLLGCFFFGGKRKLSVKQLAFSSMAIALAVVASVFLKLIHMPMGGSVTLLSMFFISLVGYWYGLGAGLTAAIAYGMLQLIIDPYILSVPQMLIDYIFAFGALGLSGIFSNAKKYGMLKGYLAGVAGRYFFTFLSGWIFFGMYAGDYGFKSGITYSLAYNGAYIGLEALITIIVISIPPVNKALKYIKDLALN